MKELVVYLCCNVIKTNRYIFFQLHIYNIRKSFCVFGDVNYKSIYNIRKDFFLIKIMMNDLYLVFD